MVEEADESNFWLTFAADVNLIHAEDPTLKKLAKESDELVAIFSASLKTLKAASVKILNPKS